MLVVELLENFPPKDCKETFISIYFLRVWMIHMLLELWLIFLERVGSDLEFLNLVALVLGTVLAKANVRLARA